MLRKEIGLRIKNIRLNMNITKQKMAELLGISGQYLGMIERGEGTLSIDKLKVLCDMTGLSADYILFGKNTNLEHETNVILSTFTDEQIELGCDTLKKLAVFIKSINIIYTFAGISHMFLCISFYL